MKAYISGPISGRPIEEAKKEFSSAAMKLIRLGYTPCNPIEEGLQDPHATWCEHMRKDLELLENCDVIVLLPNWEHSIGAGIEKLAAEKMNKSIYHINKIQHI